MTRDEIIRMARAAQLSYGSDEFLLPSVELFAALVAAAERESCADICEQHASIEGIAQCCAAAIRARGPE
jgi:hypothetical protein